MPNDSILVDESYGSSKLTKHYVTGTHGTLSFVKKSDGFISLSHFFRTVFLPQGFPESVSSDYVVYQVWDTIQAFASSITGTLAAQAVLKGVGVGDESATVLAATITWLLKDGTGMLGRILFAWMQGTSLDCDAKRWRLFADIINDIAIFLEILAPNFPTMFTFTICCAGVLKSIVGVAGGATRAALTLHQARRNNMADVSAKDGSQETLVNLAGLLCSLMLVPVVTGKTMLIWTLYIVFTSLHLYANYSAVTSVVMETLNQSRLHVLLQRYFLSGEVLPTNVVNYREPVVWKMRRKLEIQLGTSIQALCNSAESFQTLQNIYHSSQYILWLDPQKGVVYIALGWESDIYTQLQACYQAELLEFVYSNRDNTQVLTKQLQEIGAAMDESQLKLSAYMNYGLLTVHVVQARHLASTWKKQADTFVMVSLIPDDTNTARCRTGVVMDTNNPTYNDKFSFEVSEEDGNKRVLATVWHRDPHSGLHEFLGCTSFGLRNLGARYRDVNGWYYLLNEDTGRKKHLQVATRDRHADRRADTRQEIPAVNKDIQGLDILDITVHRSRYGGFGFSLVDSCPVKVGRIDGASRAEQSGLQKGDVITRVNGQNVSRSMSVSVAKVIKKSGSMVSMEIHRPRQPVTSTSPTPPSVSIKASTADDSGSNSVQEFSLYDDSAPLLQPSISMDTRRQAALHRLLCVEENFVDLMHDGMHKFSRPLRHCLLTSSQHATLFQNIEKLVSISEYEARQIQDNLPGHAASDDDDDTDTSFVPDTDLTSTVGMIYLSKIQVVCQAYSLYALGLSDAYRVLSQLEMSEDFHAFVQNTQDGGRHLSLRDFITRPLQHVQAVCDIVSAICDTTTPHSRDRATFTAVVQGLQSCVDTIVSCDVTACTMSVCAAPALSCLGPRRRPVPLMGSAILKKAGSVTSSTSSSSGFGSRSSAQSDTRSTSSSDGYTASSTADRMLHGFSI